jgi:asparagine synthase (glutamine-hydrolysing)
MCGIVGALSAVPVDRELIERMRDRLAHRGPDDAGIWSTEDQRVCLGFRRLAIVDLSPEANQPFLSGDGRHAIVLNGEIYNFRALREELAATGATFRTSSDTEVLLEAYRHWGDDCLDRLSGMFAFAIWDEDAGRLFCARDRTGEKPFYYSVVGNSFLFASELKSLLLWPGFRRELDHTAVADFLTFGSVPDPKSIWRDAAKLPPGHSLTITLRPDGPHVGEPTQYWDLAFDPDQSVTDWGPAIRAALEESAAEMSYADVPVGTFLSGGVDSSAVTAALARAGLPARAFTIGFDNADYDERPFAREVAELYRTPHTERIVRADDVEPVFRDTILWHYDEPFNDYSYLPTYYVCREARKSITVALTGDGGDELFGGYGKYSLLARRHGLERALSRPVTQLVAAGARSVLRAGDLHGRLLRYEQGAEQLLLGTLTTGIAPSTLRQIARGKFAETLADYDPMDVLRPHLDKAPPAEVGLVNSMRYLDVKLTLGAGILTKLDRASMAVSLETRPVFLNRRVLDLAGRIPPGLLADRAEPKKVLRGALREWLPSSVLDRPKQGFAMPLGRWLRGDLQGFADSAGPNDALAELVDPRHTAAVAAAHAAGATETTSELHSLVFLRHWLEKWS